MEWQDVNIASFDVGGSNFRVIAIVRYRDGKIFVRWVMIAKTQASAEGHGDGLAWMRWQPYRAGSCSDDKPWSVPMSASPCPLPPIMEREDEKPQMALHIIFWISTFDRFGQCHGVYSNARMARH